MSKKLVLIDPDLLTRLLSQKQNPTPPPNPTLQEMSHLEKNMDNTLSRGMGDPRASLQAFNSMRQAYDVHHEKYRKSPVLPATMTTQVPTDTDKQEQPENKHDIWEDEIVGSVPVTLRARARLVLRRIKNSDGKVGWNDKGELTRSGVVVPNTNIVDLVGDVLMRRKTVTAPVGVGHFMSGLRDINTPQEAIGNKARLKLLYEAERPAYDSTLETTDAYTDNNADEEVSFRRSPNKTPKRLVGKQQPTYPLHGRWIRWGNTRRGGRTKRT